MIDRSPSSRNAVIEYRHWHDWRILALENFSAHTPVTVPLHDRRRALVLKDEDRRTYPCSYMALP